jgi:16S rRNA (cytosine1402-N4)-methyltransferase
VIRELKIQKGDLYIDATLGGAGHTQEILKQGGIVLGIDQDQDALDFVAGNLDISIKNKELVVSQGNFRDIKRIALSNSFDQVSGVLFDLGLSSYQLDTSGRGFSIKHDEKLDMRMDKTAELSAYEVVNTYLEEELADIFMRFGEDDNGGMIAHEIVEYRKHAQITTTGQLVKIIEKFIKRTGKTHPATQIFQAIRIEVNAELASIKEGLAGALEVVHGGGRILVISFHSLEDRIIKRTFDDWQNKNFGKTITKKPIIADLDEVRSNPRARSAKMRVFEKNI